jgi:hypothetical protein
MDQLIQTELDTLPIDIIVNKNSTYLRRKLGTTMERQIGAVDGK